MLQRALDLLRRVLASLRSRRIVPTFPPVSFTDDAGREIHVRPYRDADFESLVAMYADFDPAQRAQGTPPLGESAVREWLADVLDGVSVVALFDGRVVGHVAFVPDGTGRHELAIFVHQEYQRAGIGTRPLFACLSYARQQSVTYVWLSVESRKHGVQNLYERAGFSVVDPMGPAHRMSRYL